MTYPRDHHEKRYFRAQRQPWLAVLVTLPAMALLLLPAILNNYLKG